MKDQEAVEFLEKHINAMMEHFDSVHVFATYRTDDGEATMGLSRGGGDWYARKGLVQEFVEKNMARNIAEAIDER